MIKVQEKAKSDALETAERPISPVKLPTAQDKRIASNNFPSLYR
jgi:hypothetical protein